jgi:23S rRNA pseudouridine1911/1915/1917 synthase
MIAESPTGPAAGRPDTVQARVPAAASRIRAEAQVPEDDAGRRFDQVAAELFGEHSRSRLTEWIRQGGLTLAGRVAKPSERVIGGEAVRLDVVVDSVLRDAPEAIELEVLYEDAACLVVNKPPGLTVHPGAGQPSGTLVNALLHRDSSLAALPRAGLVHRLDKDTSGALLIARTLTAHTALAAALLHRDVRREYVAVVRGVAIAGGTIQEPIGRHPHDRMRKAVREDGRHAVTHYRVRERMAHHSVLDLALETGRTHQIRVHLAHVGFPIIGDPLYGGGLKLPRGASDQVRDTLRQFRRQALHAQRLGFMSPDGDREVAVEAPQPLDMIELIDVLRRE